MFFCICTKHQVNRWTPLLEVKHMCSCIPTASKHAHLVFSCFIFGAWINLSQQEVVHPGDTDSNALEQSGMKFLCEFECFYISFSLRTQKQIPWSVNASCIFHFSSSPDPKLLFYTCSFFFVPFILYKPPCRWSALYIRQISSHTGSKPSALHTPLIEILQLSADELRGRCPGTDAVLWPLRGGSQEKRPSPPRRIDTVPEKRRTASINHRIHF